MGCPCYVWGPNMDGSHRQQYVEGIFMGYYPSPEASNRRFIARLGNGSLLTVRALSFQPRELRPFAAWTTLPEAYASHGILRELSDPHTHLENNIAERAIGRLWPTGLHTRPRQANNDDNEHEGDAVAAGNRKVGRRLAAGVVTHGATLGNAVLGVAHVSAVGMGGDQAEPMWSRAALRCSDAVQRPSAARL